MLAGEKPLVSFRISLGNLGYFSARLNGYGTSQPGGGVLPKRGCVRAARRLGFMGILHAKTVYLVFRVVSATLLNSRFLKC